MEPSSLELLTIDGVAVFVAHGYFGWETGVQLQSLVDACLAKGSAKYLLDFQDCRMISSPGVVAILTITTQICEEHHGDLVLTGMDQLKLVVMETSGITCFATIEESREKALEYFRNATSGSHPMKT